MARVNEWRTYRHRVSGLIHEYPTRLGDADPNLEEVEPGTKPLAYVPIPREAVELLASSETAQSEEGNSSTTKKKR